MFVSLAVIILVLPMLYHLFLSHDPLNLGAIMRVWNGMVWYGITPNQPSTYKEVYGLLLFASIYS